MIGVELKFFVALDAGLAPGDSAKRADLKLAMIALLVQSD
jgi:hypothetical protein